MRTRGGLGPYTLTFIPGRSWWLKKIRSRMEIHLGYSQKLSCIGSFLLCSDSAVNIKPLSEALKSLWAICRPGKMGGATHFTLQCGRRLRDGSYQEPVVALVCSFGLSSGGLMSPDQAKTLFHEFGHALHSLLSRTEFQHLAGEHDQLSLHKIQLLYNSPSWWK